MKPSPFIAAFVVTIVWTLAALIVFTNVWARL